MGRKILLGLIIVLTCYLMICVGVSLFSSPDDVESGGLTWDTNECKMLDYHISGDRIQIRYSVRMVNNNKDEDLEVSYFGLYFDRKDVSGWLKYERSYDCFLESGQTSVVIPSGEYVDVILLFEGEYLHGKVNENLSAPEKMIFMMELAH